MLLQPLDISLQKALTILCSVAVTRMKDVPPFGPPIPSGFTFRDPETFRNFLLAKVINAENAAHKSEKFHTMATRTRQEYLRDLAENYISNTPLDSAGKLNNLISLASKKRERSKAREGAELEAAGCVAWRVLAQDFSGGAAELSCALGVSSEYVLLIDCSTKEVVFNCFCADVIGWTPERLALKIFYGRGDHIAVRVPEGCAQDIREMVQRLKVSAQGDASSGASELTALSRLVSSSHAVFLYSLISTYVLPLAIGRLVLGIRGGQLFQ